MASYLRLLPGALIVAVLAGCVDETPSTMPAAGSRSEAPDISGVDADGKTIHLSDYRGKVVLVEFWFAGCGYCTESHQHHEQTLVPKYKGKPFAILGVNTDPSVDVMRRAEAAQHLSWHSIWDGNNSENTRTYRVKGFPTMFLIDSQGRLATSKPMEGLQNEEKLVKAIDQLLQEAEKDTVKTVAK